MSIFNEYANFNLTATYRMVIAEKMAKITATIAIQNFQWRYLTFLFFNSTFLYGVNDFFKLYNKNVLASRGLAEPRNAEGTRQYVMFSRDVQHIAYALEWMHLYNFDNTGRYIVICESDNCDETHAVQTFWYHKVTNVVFLKYDGPEISGFIYFFNGDNCAMGAPVKIDLDFCLQKKRNCKLFAEKFRNLYKCPLIASTFLQPPYMMDLESDVPRGADGHLLSILAEAINASLKIMTPHRGDGWGALDKNGTWVGSLSDVYFDLANISMTSAALTLNRFSSFQLSYNYNFVKIGWVCNPTELEAASLKLIHPFSKLTHIAVSMTFILVIVCSVLISTKLWRRFKSTNENNKNKNGGVVFYSWMICMGLSSPKLPKQRIWLYLVFLWIWYTFLIRTMYQASLINSLKTNVYSPNVDTVEEMIEQNYKFGGGAALRDYYLNYPEAYNRFIGMSFSELVKIAKRVSAGEKFAMAVNLEAASSLYFSKGERYHILSQKVVVSPTAIFFKKFSPLADSVNWNLHRLVESGIADKLYRDFVVPPPKPPTSNDQDPMTLEHFTGCYAILLGGWSVSVLIFVFEMFCGHKNKLVIH